MQLPDACHRAADIFQVALPGCESANSVGMLDAAKTHSGSAIMERPSFGGGDPGGGKPRGNCDKKCRLWFPSHIRLAGVLDNLALEGIQGNRDAIVTSVPVVVPVSHPA